MPSKSSAAAATPCASWMLKILGLACTNLGLASFCGQKSNTGSRFIHFSVTDSVVFDLYTFRKLFMRRRLAHAHVCAPLVCN